MARFLSVNKKGINAVAVCARCQTKVQYSELRQDPNDKLWVCKDCCDVLDPYRKPPRKADDITLRHPRSDEDLS